MVLLPLVPVCLLFAAAVFGQFNLEVGVATLLLSSTVAAARQTTVLGSLLSFSFFLEVSRSRRSKRRDRNTMFGGCGGKGEGVRGFGKARLRGKAEQSRGWRESVSVTLSHMAESPL